jgi:2,3-bisphosphoglycerate-independent phosphoglycerate mutase
MPSPGPVVLIIMDGWGVRRERDKNAIALAGTPRYDELVARYPSTELICSGEDVGLPRGVMGNSEVGHLNLGAGRVVWQDVTRIDRAIREGPFFTNAALAGAARRAKQKGSQLHLMGLTSDGCVHSSDRHYKALLELAKREGLSREQVCFHALLDGRDTPPNSGAAFVEQVVAWTKEIGVGRVVTVSGRYYAMDRDKRWDRVEKFHRTITLGEGVLAADPVAAIRASYGKEVTDEFMLPTKIAGSDGRPLGLLADGDEVIFFNFRADRAREICHAFVDAEFTGFQREKTPKLTVTGMTRYEKGLGTAAAFPPQSMAGLYADVLSGAGRTCFRTAETEKYAHVTFFFNGGVEQPWPGEERCLVPSPKVATYDLQPEMSAPEVARKAVEAVGSGKYDAVVMNFANCDMVGHTGILDAAIKAVRVVDEGVGKVVDATLKMSGTALVTADHGNAEEMWDYKTNQPHTAHTTNPVPFIVAGERFKGKKLRAGGRLADVAPTVVEVLGLANSAEMDGKSLLQE